MTKKPPLILNPRDVPSVPWVESDRSAHFSLLDWTPECLRNLTETRIQAALQNAHAVTHLWQYDTEPREDLTPAAVLLLLVASDEGHQVVLSTRAQHLRHHPGQVAFVGGRVEQGESAEQAALREAEEEINLKQDDVRVLGVMPSYYTISGFSVAPVVAVMTDSAWRSQDIRVDEREVDQVFLAPLAQVLDRNAWRVHHFEFQGHRRQFLSVTYASAQAEYFILGASMAMLHNFDSVLRVHWASS